MPSLLIPMSIIMIMFGDLTRIEWESDFGREHAHWMRGKCRQNDSLEIVHDKKHEAANNIFSLIQLQSSHDYSHTKTLLQTHRTSMCVRECARSFRHVSKTSKIIMISNRRRKKIKWEILNRAKWICVDCRKKTTKTAKVWKRTRKANNNEHSIGITVYFFPSTWNL